MKSIRKSIAPQVHHQNLHKTEGRQLKSRIAGSTSTSGLNKDFPFSTQHQGMIALQRMLGNQAVVRLIKHTQSTNMILEDPHNVLQCTPDHQALPTDISTQDVQYEFIAHVMAYQNKLSPYVNQRLIDWGYLRGWQKVVFNSETGLFAALLKPHRSEQLPILVFRGTNNLADVASDLNYTAIGWDQFSRNKQELADMISSVDGKIDVTGHSLGGALAQIAAVEFPDKINKAITFQSPGISEQMVARFKNQKSRPQIIHHIASGDVVDFGGDEHLPGTFYQHSTSEYVSHNGNFIEAHNRFLSFTPERRKQFEALGIDSDYLKSRKFKELFTRRPIERFEEYPHAIRRFLGSSFRRNSGLARAIHYILSG